MAKRYLVVLAGLALLIAGVLVLMPRNDRPEGAEPRPSATPSPQLEDWLPRLSEFVERQRGLKFREDVKITVLSDELFAAELGPSDPPDPAQTARTAPVLEALGLLPAGADLAALFEGADDATVGFYSAAKKELFVRGSDPTPFLRKAVVHELTHALDDQHFGLARELPDEEAEVGFDALVEGSALLVEDLYFASLSRAEQREIQAEEQAILASPAAPELAMLQEILDLPYTHGPALVQAILQAGGRARLDAAFASPPLSAEQVVDPSRYLSGDLPREVARPPAEGPVVDEGQIGQVALRLLLQTQLDPRTAEEAAAGWGGDRYIAWQNGTRTCVRAIFVSDTPEDARQLEQAIAAWVDKREVAESFRQILKVCGPFK